MTPGLAFFYGGMTRAKSTLNMMMMSFVTIGIVSILWVIYGYSLAFGTDTSTSQYFGAFDVSHLSSGINALTNNGGAYTIPVLVFAAFQLMFAVITPALISGSIADRTKFVTWGIFVAIWVSVVYFPVGWRKDPMRPHNVPLVLIVAGLLWFGWFGFNAGSALGANGTAALAFMNTQVATAAALIGWLIVEKIRDGHPTSLGAASGAVAGLVAITPACAFIAPWAAVVLGLVAGAVCATAVGLKYKFGFDDSLDVVGVHLVGGIIGCLSVGFFGSTAVNSAYPNGIFYGGGTHLLLVQAKGVGFVLAYSFIVTLILGFILNKTIGFRIDRDAEIEGIDYTEHAESGYEFENRGAGSFGSVLTGAVKEGA